MRRLIAVHFVLTALMLAPLASGQPASDIDRSSGELQRLRHRVAELEQENAALRAELAQVRQSAAALLEQSRDLQNQRDDLVQERDTLEQLAGLTASGEAVASARARFTSDYDARTDRTTVQSVTEKVDPGLGFFNVEHHLRVRYEHPGQAMKTPPDHVLVDVLTLVSPSQRYRSLDEAQLVLDGETVTLPVEDYEIVRTRRYGASVAGQRRYDEQLTLRLPAEALRQIGRSREATLRLGDIELPLEGKHLALFEAARQRLAAEAP